MIKPTTKPREENDGRENLAQVVRGRDSGRPRLPGRAITQNLFESARVFPNRTAVVFENCVLTYGELDDKVRRFAAGLAALGVKPGTRVAIQLPNLPQTVIAYYAALALGAQVVMTNPLYVEREIDPPVERRGDRGRRRRRLALPSKLAGDPRAKLPAQALRHHRHRRPPPLPRWLARFKLTERGTGREGDGGAGGAPLLPPSIATHPPDRPADDRPRRGRGAAVHRRNDRPLEGGDAHAPQPLVPSAAGHRVVPVARSPGGEVWLSCLPFFHVFGMTIAMNWPVAIGARWF